MKMNFEYFQIQKSILQTARAEKVDGKNGVICLVSMFISERSHYALSENGIVYYAMTYYFGDIRV